MILLLKERCFINTNLQDDKFVGLKIEGQDYKVHFPLGFSLSDNEEDIREDILLLFNTLSENTDKIESDNPLDIANVKDESSVLISYLYILKDYFSRGYYKEHVVEYSSSKKGKINWNRTIKNKKPCIQGSDVFYLDFITKKTTVNDNDIITLIHKYCVYRSFFVIGWIFTDFMPEIPDIEFDKEWFAGVISARLSSTFNDRNKALFQNMLKIILSEPDEGINTKDFTFGTNRFEYVWERMIDSVFGIPNKDEYFPSTAWNIAGRGSFENAVLEPDTIMVYGKDVYVLDAKYYKFGWTKHPGDLPESSSINKQITYGEYIDETQKFREIHGEDMKVYNAFLMPFDALKWDVGLKHYIGDAVSRWKSGTKEYEHIKGILLDVKYLMKISGRKNYKEIKEMAELILSSCGSING